MIPKYPMEYNIECPVCKTKLIPVHHHGIEMFYAVCPNNKDKKHIFEVGPYRTEKSLLKKLGEINEQKDSN